MARRKKEAVGGGRLERTETVTVRLDAQTRYLAELAARKQRRTLSSYIDWAIAESFKAVSLQEIDGIARNPGGSIADEVQQLWDVDESSRFLKLMRRHPDILTHGEQALKKLAEETVQWVAQEVRDGCEKNGLPSGAVVMIWPALLREHWKSIQEAARGESSREELLNELKQSDAPAKALLKYLSMHAASQKFIDIFEAADRGEISREEVLRKMGDGIDLTRDDFLKAIQRIRGIESLTESHIQAFQRGEITLDEFLKRLRAVTGVHPLNSESGIEKSG